HLRLPAYGFFCFITIQQQQLSFVRSIGLRLVLIPATAKTVYKYFSQFFYGQHVVFIRPEVECCNIFRGLFSHFCSQVKVSAYWLQYMLPGPYRAGIAQAYWLVK